MTQDYLACLIPEDEPAMLPASLIDALAKQGCRARSNEDGLLLFAGDDLPVLRMAEANGWVIGQLFDREGTSGSAHGRIEHTEPSMILEKCWGSYVLVSRMKGQWQLLRDPSGGLPCYHAQVDGRHYFTSLPHLLIDCGLVTGAIDWVELWRSLADHSARSHQTAICGIGEILPGTAVRLSRESSEHRAIWDPWAHAFGAPPDNPAEALRMALCATLESWGRRVRRPLIEISGGLDSAIVAAGLSRASPGASLITFAAAPGDPDETLYARAIADHLALELTIVHPSTGDVDLRHTLSADLPRPNARAFTQAADALSLQRGRAIGADAFVSGGGGDDVFCYLRTILPAVDRLRTEGAHGMMSSLVDIAVMNHSTVWEAMYRTVRRLVRRRSTRNPLDLRFLNAEHSADLTPRATEPTEPRLPGKAEHVQSVLGIHNYLEGHARAKFAPIISPLLSQPIVECCLSIPAWRWCEGGRNRAVARCAFNDLLPAVVLHRRSKGHFDGFCAALFDTNRELIRAMLLEGHVARQRLLDPNAIEGALANPFPSGETVTRLLTLVDVESWAASWLSRPVHRR